MLVHKAKIRENMRARLGTWTVVVAVNGELFGKMVIIFDDATSRMNIQVSVVDIFMDILHAAQFYSNFFLCSCGPTDRIA